MKSKILSIIVFVCAVAAAVTSYNLLTKHVMGKSDQTWFEWGCSDSREPGAANCAAVLASPYSCIPPRDPEKPGLCIPAALFGLCYFLTLAVWMAGVGVPSQSRSWLHIFPTVLVAGGIIGSGFFVWVMFSKLEQWCPWCAVTHALNLIIAVCIVLMWPASRRRAAIAKAMPQAGPVNEGRVRSSSKTAGVKQVDAAVPPKGNATVLLPSPAARAVVMTFIAAAVVNFAALKVFHEMQWKGAAQIQKSGFDRCMMIVDGIKKNSDALFAMWSGSARHDIPASAGDPVREIGTASTGKPVDIVVFSDFECPGCQGFAAAFESRIAPMFSMPVRLRFKNYPLDKACNPQTEGTVHPHACEGARLAAAALSLGGNEAFWRAHDYLFAHRDDLARGGLTVEQFAAAVGLPADKVQEQLGSAAIAQRIAEDARLGREVGVMSTPAVFVEGRAVDQLAKNEPGFWKKLADALVAGEAP